MPVHPKNSQIITPKGGNPKSLGRTFVKKLTPKKVETKFKTPNNSNKGLITQNFKLLLPIFKNSIPTLKEDNLSSYIKCVIDTHNSFIKNLGIEFGTAHFKKITNYAILLCEGREALPVNRVSTGKTDKWPNCFGPLRPIYRIISDDNIDKTTRANYFKLLLTLFKLNRVCEDFSVLDIKDISKDFKLEQSFLTEFEKYLKVRLENQKNNVQSNLTSLKVNPIMGPANGPNGTGKILSADLEAYALSQDKKLFEAFAKICDLTENSSFLDYVKRESSSVTRIYESNNKKPKLKTGNNKFKEIDLKKIILRKLVGIPAPGNKSRTVAICDFWTQCLLAPMEKSEENELKTRFSNHSCFYSHSLGFKKALTECNSDWVSLDATAWTDNFPVQLQRIYLKLRYGVDYANAWYELAAGCSWNIGSTDLTIKYGKGQGMGTKGSFMLASIVDHYVIEFILEKHYGKVTNYQKVGDDLVVEDKNNVLMQFYPTIGVQVNSAKSKFLTSKGHFMEFVSRNVWDGNDISPYSANLIYKSIKQPYLLPTLLRHINERTISQITLDLLIESINLPSKEKVKLYQLIQLYTTLTGDKEFCVIPSGVELLTNLQILKIYIAIINDSLSNALEKVQKERYKNDDQTMLLTLSMQKLVSELNNDQWALFIDEGMDLERIKLFQFFKGVLLQTPYFSMVTEENVEETVSSEPFLNASGEPNDQLNKLVFDSFISYNEILMTHKMVGKINSSSSSRYIIDMFVALNKFWKLRDDDVVIKSHFEPFGSACEEIAKAIKSKVEL